MSLINNMLKDIEYREKNNANVAYLPLRRSSSKYVSLATLLKTISSLAAFCLLIFIIHTLFFKHHTIPVAKFIKEANAIATTANTIDNKWQQINNISGITIQNKDQLTELTFLLDRPALYRLVSDEMQNQLIVYIDRSHFKAEIPTLGGDNRAINKISSEEIKGETKFTIAFAAGATLKYVNQNTTNGHPELILTIAAGQNEAQEDIATFPTDNTIKSPTIQNVLSQQYQKALLNAETGHYQLAMDDLNHLLKMDPQYKDARVSLIALLIDQDKVEEAQALIQVGLAQNPEFIPFIELKARVFALEGKYKQALSTLQAHSPSIDENPEYHAFVAAMYQRNNEYSLSAQLYKKLLALNNNNSSWWFGLGVSLDKMGQQKTALMAYKRAAAIGNLNPESVSYLQNRMHELQEALDDKE